MTNRLVTTNIWPKITAAVKKSPGGCFVAVAYFGTGASKLLPLRKGSTLIVDMSQAAVGSGQTNPSEILKLVNRGVDVHSVANLHAKVFAVGNQAFVGSANVSNNSATGLVEAVLQTTNATVVAACRKFVRDLRGELVTPEFAKRMQKCWHPPKFSHAKNGSNPPKKQTPKHAPLWLVPLYYTDWDDEDRSQESQGLPTAKSRLRSARRFRVDDFCWSGAALSNRLSNGDLVVEVFDEGKGRKMLVPPSRVVHLRRYKVGREKRAIVYLERAKKPRQKNVLSVVKRLGPKAKEIKKLTDPKAVRDWSFAHALLNLWPTANGG